MKGLLPVAMLCASLLFVLPLCAQKGPVPLLSSPAASQPLLEKKSVPIGQDLQRLYQQNQASKASSLRTLDLPAADNERSRTLITRNNKVLVNITLAAGSKTTKAELENAGVEVTAMVGRMVSGFIPVDRIPQLALHANLKFLRPAYRSKQQVKRGQSVPPLTQAVTGPVVSQGDASLGSDEARTKYKVSGKGVKIGILSDSYNSLNTAGTGVLNGELPAVVTSSGSPRDAVQVLEEGYGFGTDEGRAIAEIIHDVAPGAEIAFHTAAYGQASFAQGILDLAALGCNILVDDALYPDEPFFQDGIIAQAINTAKKKGVTYFSAAGNNASFSYESNYRPSDYSPFEANFIRGTAHNFSAPGNAPSYFQPINIPRNHLFMASFQWNQPFYSAGGWGAETDMDIFLLDANGTIIRSGLDDNITTGDPVEMLNFFNDTPGEVFYIAILKYKGPDPGLVKWVSFGDEIGFYVPSPAPPGLYASALVGHPNAAGAIAVAAANYLYTPAFGINPPQAEFFSSCGGVAQYFDDLGNPISPVVRKKPDVTAPDAGNNSFFSIDSRQDLDEYPNFFGTSASAAHAGGVAALMIEAQKLKTITPEQIRGILASKTVDMDDINTIGFDQGFDYKTGTGFIRAEAAIDAVRFPKVYIKNLQVEAGCSDNPATVRNWKMNNPNPFGVKANWLLAGFQQHGTVTLQPGITPVATGTGYLYNREVPNIVILEWEDNFGFPHIDVAVSTPVNCSAAAAAGQPGKAGNLAAGEPPSRPAVAEAFPNPFRQSFKLYLSVPGSQQLEVELFAVDGRQIFRRTVSAEGVVNIDAARYKAGMYYLKIAGLRFNKTVQLVKMP